MFANPPSDERPLPERLRPNDPQDLFGQEHIWDKSSPLRKLAESDNVSALILWGPPGTGKTTLARLIGSRCQRELIVVSAVHATVKELRAIMDDSLAHQQSGRKGHLLFIDEIHRLSKSQQDVLLPALESGQVRFIGATTENPSFSVNNAILSRSLTFQLKPLTQAALLDVLRRALRSGDRVIGNTEASDDALNMIAQAARGDARQALNILSAALSTAAPGPDGVKQISADTLTSLSSCLPLRYDRDTDQHYDTISAMIKSIRASHPDAAVYYLARMIEGGEDPLFIARRLLISASEDVGNANPTALLIADSAFRAVEVLGLPEARIALSQCVTYLASSPKSNRAYNAINDALSEVRGSGPLEIPMHLRNAPTRFMRDLGYGAGYAYAHDDLEGARQLPYLPERLRGRRFYDPRPVGTEKQLIENLKHLRPLAD
jgi:putative ATPase